MGNWHIATHPSTKHIARDTRNVAKSRADASPPPLGPSHARIPAGQRQQRSYPRQRQEKAAYGLQASGHGGVKNLG